MTDNLSDQQDLINADEVQHIPLSLAILPIVFLIVLLSLNVAIFKDDALSGSNQMVLLISAAVAGLVGKYLGLTWQQMQDGIVKSIMAAIPAIIILLLVGSLAGTWLLSGIIPAMIYFGLQILSPAIFLIAACVICAIVSIATGSSWTTSATIGIALMGIGQALGLPAGMIGGAVLSGAYFGDKLSPLSDTTNLAAAVSGTDLFTHIRYMLYTTVPSFCITLVLFFILGLTQTTGGGADNLDILQQAIRDRFNITGWLFLVPAAVVIMILRRVPPIPALFAGVLLGALFALLFQPKLVADIAGADTLDWTAAYIGLMQAAYGEISIVTGQQTLDELLSSGGMSGMLGTVWLILSAMIFGGVMEAVGLLRRIVAAIIHMIRSTASLIASTVGTCLFFNITSSDQYLSVVVPGRMFHNLYAKKGLAPQNLSRSLEDSGTVTSVLVPWNTCGAFHANVLNVATLAYLPFCFFNIISPLMTLVYAVFNIKIARINPATTNVESKSDQ